MVSFGILTVYFHRNQESIGDSEVYDEIVNLLHEHYKETKNSSKLKDGKVRTKDT